MINESPITNLINRLKEDYSIAELSVFMNVENGKSEEPCLYGVSYRDWIIATGTAIGQKILSSFDGNEGFSLFRSREVNNERDIVIFWFVTGSGLKYGVLYNSDGHLFVNESLESVNPDSELHEKLSKIISVPVQLRHPF
ncbi:MAG: hypothetical protein ACR2MX_01625 [Cyclobacteriaceae bacterium]